ncbi:rCG28962, partial [Rattus norvegicus]
MGREDANAKPCLMLRELNSPMDSRGFSLPNGNKGSPTASDLVA